MVPGTLLLDPTGVDPTYALLVVAVDHEIIVYLNVNTNPTRVWLFKQLKSDFFDTLVEIVFYPP
jgi:hypothetical protein